MKFSIKQFQFKVRSSRNRIIVEQIRRRAKVGKILVRERKGCIYSEQEHFVFEIQIVGVNIYVHSERIVYKNKIFYSIFRKTECRYVDLTFFSAETRFEQKIRFFFVEFEFFIALCKRNVRNAALYEKRSSVCVSYEHIESAAPVHFVNYDKRIVIIRRFQRNADAGSYIEGEKAVYAGKAVCSVEYVAVVKFVVYVDVYARCNRVGVKMNDVCAAYAEKRIDD